MSAAPICVHCKQPVRERAGKPLTHKGTGLELCWPMKLAVATISPTSEDHEKETTR